jgi:hypothetical protein
MSTEVKQGFREITMADTWKKPRQGFFDKLVKKIGMAKLKIPYAKI